MAVRNSPSPFLAALAAAAAVSGCGGGAAPAPDAGVRAALERLDRAQAAGDARTACGGLIAVEERGRIEVPGASERDGADADAGGAACERAFAVASASRRALRGASLDVGSVRVAGERATATVRTLVTRADGSSLRQEATRRLIRRDGRWRVLVSAE